MNRTTPSHRGLTVVVVTLLALTAIPTLAVADPPKQGPDDDQDHGDISRTFTYYALARAEFKGNGLGWYDQDDPNRLCLFSLLGVQISVAGSFYYETARIAVNLNKHVVEDDTSLVIPTDGLPVPLNCPGAPATATSPAIQYHGVNIFTGWYTPQSTLLCTQKPFATCEPTDVGWWVYACKDDVEFERIDKNKATLTMFILNDIVKNVDPDADVGSRAIICGNADDQELHHAHNVTEKMRAQSPMTGSQFQAVPIDRIVHAGQGDRYAISCVEVAVSQFDPGPPPTLTERRNKTHDWFLVLDRTDPTTWAGSVLDHLGLPPTLPPPPPPGSNHYLPGWFDLSGDNGCPFPWKPECHQEDKKGFHDDPKNKPGKHDCEDVIKKG